MNKLNQTVAVVRTYNNRAVVKTVRSLTAFIGHVIVVVRNDIDKGSTRAWLAGMRNVSIIEMDIGYSWSNALNRALHKIVELNVDRARPYRYVLNVSVEARFTKDHVLEMLNTFTDSDVGVVGTSFSATQDGNPVGLGVSYMHPRNTGMIVDLRVFENPMLRLGFDPFCDDIGGMEDIDFIYRLAAFSDFKTEMLDLCVPLVVGVNHNQELKEAAEQAAMRKIFARYEQWAERFKKVKATAEYLGILD